MEGGEILCGGADVDHEAFMRAALQEAEQALERGDRPIGAVIVHRNRIIARASNAHHTGRNLIAHAEMRALHACAPYLLEHGRECVKGNCEALYRRYSQAEANLMLGLP